MPWVTISREEAAALAGGEEAAVQRPVHRDVQAGVVEHHHRILAAHLQLELGPRATQACGMR